MAKVIPFRGILYNPDKIGDLSDVVAPPYDVISKQDQQNFYDRHPNNIIRLILGKTTEFDTVENNVHTRAAAFYKKWLSDKILLKDKSPAFYLTSVDFSLENKAVSRYGLIARVGLEPFDTGVVLPHEKTFSQIKSERLELMKTCHANFSPIFSLYSDRNNILGTLKEAALKNPPDIDLLDHQDRRHRLWRITDPSVHRYVTDAMGNRTLFIADGHHRYETALNYKERVSRDNPGFSDDHPANYIMMCLCSMEDPGLVILPAHRMLTNIQESVLSKFIRKAEKYFDIRSIPFEKNGREKSQAEFISDLRSGGKKNTIGAFLKGCSKFFLLTLKPNLMEQRFGDEIPESLRKLDVTVLTRLILVEILGFDNSRLDNEKQIAYSSTEKEAIEAVASGRCDITFILNPTKIEQVRDIAKTGLTMPRKSTYFYPKVITGQVLNDLNPD
ncbi:MAG TPA: DUF1015 domain-containing protein [Desulfobacterales bacterium]|nr:DUF1015 domain-containing protein [Desulfobacterales bacterium]